MDEKKNIKERNDLTDKDFYDQACQYFYYHAEQRITMINYFIAVFGAGIALYGNVIEKSPIVAGVIAGFLLIISILFCSIDFRNKFDVKQSQSVIAQIEHDYGRDLLNEGANSTYGVFSNEDNTFRYYGLEHRKEEINTEYREIREIYRKIKHLKKKKEDKEVIELLEKELDSRIDDYLTDDDTISKTELKKSMGTNSILSLSNSIKDMYILCMFASLLGMLYAVGKAGVFDGIMYLIRLILN